MLSKCDYGAVRVITPRRLREFSKKDSDAVPSLARWYVIVRHAQWRTLAEVKRIFPQTDLVGRRTVFNIAGNKYRLIARINYRRQIVYILAILTHAEYDKEQWE